MNFEIEKFYHIYTRANSQADKLFREDDNYKYFLRKYKKNISPIFETLCYCLIPNHYHFLIKVKKQETIFNYQKRKGKKYKNNEIEINSFIQQQIANFHISYAKAFNQLYKRRGSLFQSKPKAKEISDTNYLLQVSRYIHRNPLKHGVVKNIKDWKYSSYLDYADLRNGLIPNKEFLVSHFSSIKEFLDFTEMEFNENEYEYLEK
ncbi:MAG: transposase [Patescibacteria group bacterium]|nr:transposase [Patescibacteria group bacterium]